MQNKIKLLLSGLLIQACFFSSPVFAGNWYQCVATDTKNNTGTYSNDYGNLEDPRTCQGEVCAMIPQGVWLTYTDDSGLHCEVDGSNITVYANAVFCQQDETINSTTGVCEPAIPALDCSNATDSLITGHPGTSLNPNLTDSQGCAYSYTGGDEMCMVFDGESWCAGTFTGTGSPAIEGTTIGSSGDELITSIPDGEQIIELNDQSVTTNLPPDTICDGAGENCVTSETNTEVSTNGTLEKTLKDGSVLTRTIKEGAEQTVISDTVTTQNPDGSETIVENYTVTTKSGDTNTTVTNITNNTSTTTTTTGPTTSSNEKTTTQIAADGSIDSVSVDTEIGFENPNPSTCGYGDYPDCKTTISDEGVDNSGSQTSYDGTISGYGLAPPTDGVTTSALSVSISSAGSSCVPSDYYMTVMGFSFEPEMCVYIDIFTSILFWLFNVITAWFVYDQITRSLRGHA